MNDQNLKLSRSDASLPISADLVFDATNELIGKKFKEGLNPIMRSQSGLELMAKATPGEIIEYVVLDRNGEMIDERIEIRVTNQKEKKTTCWECGKDADGNTHCWKIPCPVIVGPWTPGKTIEIGFRFQ